ncbi:hypothetical protein F4774DRAFT_407896 [Daldinia eschscholtzii]|nr:hypothetical protein F4774DRAFT_407896 [Daldinia eschscholtzii]
MLTPCHREYTLSTVQPSPNPAPVPAHCQCFLTKNCQAGLMRVQLLALYFPSRDLIQTQKSSSFSISRRQVGIIKLCPTQLPPARFLLGLQDPTAISPCYKETGRVSCAAAPRHPISQVSTNFAARRITGFSNLDLASTTGDFACPTLSSNLRHRVRTSQD